MPVMDERPVDDLEPGGDGVTGGGGGGYVPPPFVSGDWARIATLAPGRTDYRSTNFARREGGAVNLNGSYGVVGVTADTITLANPEEVNPAWENIITATGYGSPSLSTAGEGWVGPFVVTHPAMTELVINIYAPQGMYLVTKKGKDRPRSVNVLVEATPVDPAGVAIGATQTFNVTVAGDGKDKAPKGTTLRAPVALSNRYRVRVRRTTPKNYDSEDTIVDEVKWRDGYATAPVYEPHFGDVTTIQTRTYATSGATGVKDRKLNCRVTRKVRRYQNVSYTTMIATGTPTNIILAPAGASPDYLAGALLGFEALDAVPEGFGPSIELLGVTDGDPRLIFTEDGSAAVPDNQWVAGDIVLVYYHAPTGRFRFSGIWTPELKQFSTQLLPSRNAADIICAMALDPFIGGRSVAELDVDQIYNEVDEVVDYFGIPDVGRFDYTFDQSNVSFEEMVQTVAQAVFCTAYRQGSQLRLFFEKATDDSTLLFNHRNKIPGSEKRTIRFGRFNDNDGVEFDYVSAADGATLTIYLPEDQSAVKPKKIEVRGVTSDKTARLHAGRAWQKIQHQHTSAEFIGLSEATQLVLNERIEITDNTRPDVHDGHVVSQDGLTLELTQPFTATEGVAYTIFLQHPEGGVETRSIEATEDPHRVVLLDAPSFAIITDPDVWADTTYQIVGDDAARSSAFLLTEKGAYDKRTITLQAINYDARYYQDDELFRPPGWFRFDIAKNSGYLALLEDI